VALKPHGGGLMKGALRAGDHVAAEQHQSRRLPAGDQIGCIIRFGDQQVGARAFANAVVGR
jgi:hypothetical protein